jgi:hypothetical protein
LILDLESARKERERTVTGNKFIIIYCNIKIKIKIMKGVKVVEQ